MTKLTKRVVALGLALTMMMGTSSVLAKDYNTAGDGETLFGIGVTQVKTQNVSFSVPLYVVMVADEVAGPLATPTNGYGIQNMSIPNVGGGTGPNVPPTNSGRIAVQRVTVRALRDWTIAGTAGPKNVTLSIGGVSIANAGTGAATVVDQANEFFTETFAPTTSFNTPIEPNTFRNIPLAGTTTAANTSTVANGAVSVMSQFRVLYTVAGVDPAGAPIGLAPGVGDTNIWGPSMDVNP